MSRVTRVIATLLFLLSVSASGASAQEATPYLEFLIEVATPCADSMSKDATLANADACILKIEATYPDPCYAVSWASFWAALTVSRAALASPFSGYGDSLDVFTEAFQESLDASTIACA